MGEGRSFGNTEGRDAVEERGSSPRGIHFNGFIGPFGLVVCVNLQQHVGVHELGLFPLLLFSEDTSFRIDPPNVGVKFPEPLLTLQPFNHLRSVLLPTAVSISSFGKIDVKAFW